MHETSRFTAPSHETWLHARRDRKGELEKSSITMIADRKNMYTGCVFSRGGTVSRSAGNIIESGGSLASKGGVGTRTVRGKISSPPFVVCFQTFVSVQMYLHTFASCRTSVLSPVLLYSFSIMYIMSTYSHDSTIWSLLWDVYVDNVAETRELKTKVFSYKVKLKNI